MPPAAFVVVPRLPQPPFECQLLLPDAETEHLTNDALEPASHCWDDSDSLHDYQQQTDITSSLLMQHCKFTKHSEQPM